MSKTTEKEAAYLVSRFDAIIREQAGETTFRHLDSIRRMSAEGRKSKDGSRSALKRSSLNRLSVSEALRIGHAFSLFFQFVNLCEERARIRHLRTHDRPTMSIRALMKELKAAKVKPADLQRCLEELEIQPVLTAHPTEAKRRILLRQMSRLEANWENPDEVLEALWHTEEVREARVGPLQEIENALSFFERSIFEAAGEFYSTFDRELQEAFPDVNRKNAFLSFGSWVGGDRDGNPFVTPELSCTTADAHADLAFHHYERECVALVGELSHACHSHGPVDNTIESESLTPFQPYEVFRTTLLNICDTLKDRTIEPGAFLSSLKNIQQRLRQLGAHRAASGRLQRLIYQVETFGFHLARLDFRDHSGKLDQREPELVSELSTMNTIQKKHGRTASDHFILSMTRSSDDILKVHRLARLASLDDVDIVPLFETIGDLKNAGKMLAELWGDTNYRAHLKRRGTVQEVMVGYSDSNKDGGYLAANWFLHRAQKEMSRIADECGVKLRFFHGKGGSIDRGGGASHRSLRAQPHAVHGGRLRITEQGEVISLKYSNPAIAVRNLEQLTSAVIASQCLPDPTPKKQIACWESNMDELAQCSFDFYQRFVYHTPEFAEYFWEATPIDLIEHLRLGSRPTRRQATRDVSQLRAIPWVFAWTQSRQLISAWYGLGHALSDFAGRHSDGLTRLKTMYQRWPFFRQLLDNAEISLAKTELGIARDYAALVKSTVVRNKVFGMIEPEYQRSVSMVLNVTGRKQLLENQPVLAHSLEMRNPCVDPLNYLQIRFLKRWRAAGEKQRTEQLRRLLALTVNGIAFGMKSTG